MYQRRTDGPCEATIAEMLAVRASSMTVSDAATANAKLNAPARCLVASVKSAAKVPKPRIHMVVHCRAATQNNRAAKTSARLARVSQAGSETVEARARKHSVAGETQPTNSPRRMNNPSATGSSGRW